MKQLLTLLSLFGCIACSESGNANHEALIAKKIICPDGVTSEYSGWGPNGMQEVCKLKHGPFIAAEDGRIALEGEYNMGKPSGTWIWYDKSGRVQKTEKY